MKITHLISIFITTFLITLLSSTGADAVNYYLTAAGAGSAQTPGNWNTVADGSGTAAANFSTNGSVFIINAGTNGFISGDVIFGSATRNYTLTMNINGSLTINSSNSLFLKTSKRVGDSKTYMNVNNGGSLNFLGTAGNQLTTASETIASDAIVTFSSGSTLKTTNVNGISGSINTTALTLSLNTDGNYEFNGNLAQVTSGMPAAVNNLNINNISGVTLADSTTVNGTLTLTNGNLITGSFSLVISSTGSVSRTSGHVYGKLRKYITTVTTNKNFEIGDASNYTPVNINFDNVSVAGYLTAWTTSGNHPDIANSTIDISKSINRYWTLTNSGIVFTSHTATFNFIAGDLDAGANTSNFIVGNYYGATWTIPTVGTRTSTSTQATGITTFGDFAVGELYVAQSLRLVITGTATQTAGALQNLTITAKDSSGSTVTSYTGDKSLVFSGAASSSNPVTVPTVTDKDGTAIDFGTATTITFIDGVATVSDNNNGVMRLYKAEQVEIGVTDGSYSATGLDKLQVAVSTGALNKFSLSLSSPQKSGDVFTGTNTITAQDIYGNTVTTFDTSVNNVTITALPNDGTIIGLGSGNNAVLNQVSDFSSGVANLTTLGMIFTGTVGNHTFTATSSTGSSGISGTVDIVSATIRFYYLTAAGAATAQLPSSWNTNADGSGTAAITFDTNGDTFIINAGTNGFISGDCTFGANSKNKNVTMIIKGSLSISSNKYLILQGLLSDTNINVDSGGSLDFLGSGGNQLTATSSTTDAYVTFYSGSTLKTANADGISGSINTTNLTLSLNTNGNYEFTSNFAQVTSGMPSTVNSLTINNVSGVTLADSTTVNGTLTLTSGNLTTGNYALIISSTGSVSRTSGYVNGQLRKYISTGTTNKNFEIGDAFNYTPVNVNFDNVSVAGYLTAWTTSGDHPNIINSSIDGSKSVNRYWTLTNSGITFTSHSTTFNFVAGDLDAGANTSSFIVGNKNGATWIIPTVSSRTSTSTQVTGMTIFGDFIIGNEYFIPEARLVITGSATQTAGASQDLTITARYSSGSTITSYTGDKILIFSGAGSSSNPVTAPSVSDKDGNDITFGTATTITFTDGVATVSGTNNGVMKLYAAESVDISVTDGSYLSTGNDILHVTVSAGPLNKFVLNLSSPQKSGDVFTGTNTVTAQDIYGNTVTTFDASANNVTIMALPSDGTIIGLGTGNNAVLNQVDNFSSGVANLTTLAMIFTGTVGEHTFTATSSTGSSGTSGTVLIMSANSTLYYLTAAGSSYAQTPNSWNTVADGSGTAATNFLTNGDTFIINAGTNGFISGACTFGGNRNTINVTMTIKGSLSISANNALLLQTNGTTMINVENGGSLNFLGTGETQLTTTSTNASVTFSSGSTLKTANVNGISGSINSTAMTLSLNTAGNYEFNGSFAQDTSGMPSTVNSLTINNVSGVTLADSTTVNGTLFLTNGKLITSYYALIISSTGSVSRTSGYVDGKLRKYIGTGTTNKNFEIGDTSNYTPLNVNFNNVSAAGYLTASTTSGDHPDIANSTTYADKNVNRYWTLTNSGITLTTYNATFNFVAGDLDVGANTNNFIVVNKNGENWTTPTVGTKTSTSIQATGVTTFGDFLVGISIYPDIVILKSVYTFSDPMNGTTNPKAIPGARMLYTINISNQGTGYADSNTVVINDDISSNTKLFVNDLDPPNIGPVRFIDGSTSSSLQYTFNSLSDMTDDLDFSNNNGSAWTYIPTPDEEGCDPNVTNIRVNPKKVLAGRDDGIPSFEIKYIVRVK